MTLPEWCEDNKSLKLEFFEKEASTFQGLLKNVSKENDRKYFVNSKDFELESNLTFQTKLYSISICPITFFKLKNKFRYFIYKKRNTEQKRSIIQIVLDEKTHKKIEELPRIMGEKNLNNCLSILIEFYNKNRLPRLKAESIIKLQYQRIEELQDFIDKNSEIFFNNCSKQYFDQKIQKKLNFLIEKIIDEKSKNYIFEEYKKQLTDDGVREIENYLSESDFQKLKNEIKESIDRELNLIDWETISSKNK